MGEILTEAWAAARSPKAPAEVRSRSYKVTLGPGKSGIGKQSHPRCQLAESEFAVERLLARGGIDQDGSAFRKSIEKRPNDFTAYAAVLIFRQHDDIIDGGLAVAVGNGPAEADHSAVNPGGTDHGAVFSSSPQLFRVSLAKWRAPDQITACEPIDFFSPEFEKEVYAHGGKHISFGGLFGSPQDGAVKPLLLPWALRMGVASFS